MSPIAIESRGPRMTATPTHRVCGVRVDALTATDLTGAVAAAIARGERRIVANHNLHSVYLFHHDAKMRRFYSMASHVHVDGMSLVFLARLAGVALRRSHRVTYVDWMEHLLPEADANRWRVFHLGSSPEVARRGAEILRERFPRLEIGMADGYFDMTPGSRENELRIGAINEFVPYVLLVGMGMPRQEHWVVDNVERVSANAILTSGAAMDYLAGAVPVPPRITGRLGLEWLCRLCFEPRRLWRRYLVEPWALFAMIMAPALFGNQAWPDAAPKTKGA